MVGIGATGERLDEGAAGEGKVIELVMDADVPVKVIFGDEGRLEVAIDDSARGKRGEVSRRE